jgi:molybdopterin molybdotransferase
LFFHDSMATLASNARTEPGAFIHRRASDCPAGTTLLTPPTVLNPSHLGLAATLGKTKLAVTRQPRITLISTGDEMIPPSQTPLPHQLRQSNGPTLAAALQSLFFPSRHLTHHHLPDDLALTEQALANALQNSDLILITGGISKGKMDFIRPALEKQLGPPAFHGVTQRPGKPLAFWKPTAQTPAVFALPGNPNSTFTTFHRYVRPALRLLAGHEIEPPVTLPCSERLSPHPELTLFLPARLQPNGHLDIALPQNSGDLASPLQATGFVEIPPGTATTSVASYRSFSAQL